MKRWGADRVRSGVRPGPRGRGGRRDPREPHARSGAKTKNKTPALLLPASSRGGSPVTPLSSRPRRGWDDDRPVTERLRRAQIAHGRTQARTAPGPLPERLTLTRNHEPTTWRSWSSCSPTSCSAGTETQLVAGRRATKLHPTVTPESWDETAAVTAYSDDSVHAVRSFRTRCRRPRSGRRLRAYPVSSPPSQCLIE